MELKATGWIEFFLLVILFIERRIVVPVIRFYAVLSKNKWLNERLRFEQRGLGIDSYYTSFKVEQKEAELAFHISSEGELEQIFPLLSSALEQNKLIELLFTSPSVEMRVVALAKQHKNLRILPLPLLLTEINIAEWVSAPKIILCRYDFFPELLLLCAKCHSVLVGASVKKYREQLEQGSWWVTRYWRMIFSLFNLIIPATKQDRELILALTNKQQVDDSFDFRILRIFARLDQAQTILQQRLGRDFITLIESFKRRLVIGSGWESEIDAIANNSLLQQVANRELFIYFAPHRLDDEFFYLFKERVQGTSQIPVYRISKNTNSKEISEIIKKYHTHPGIIYSQIPGILCEIYSLFNFALVGGGWGRSVHSVLEPALANAVVFCGPKTFRSTEVDLVKNINPSRLIILEKVALFSTTLLNFSAEEDWHIREYRLAYQQRFEHFKRKIIDDCQAT